MDSRERIYTTIDHREPDRIPIDLGTTNSTGIAVTTYRKVLEYLGKSDREIKLINLMQQLAYIDEDILEMFGIDTRGIAANPVTEIVVEDGEDHRRYTDEWGIKWKKPSGGFYFDMVENPLKSFETVEQILNFDWADPKDPKRVKGLDVRADYIKNELHKIVLLKGIVPGVMEFAAWLRGYEQFMMDLYIAPDIANAILDKAAEIKIGFWDLAIAKFGSDIDIINESDDLGTQTGPLISLDMYREFIRPRHQRIVDNIKRRCDAKIFLHSCGSIYDFIPDLIEIGFDIINPLQVTAKDMDPVRLKKEFGRDVTFWGGGMDTQDVLPNGTAQQVREEVKKRIDQLAAGGGFIFAPIHNIQADVPAENVVAMLEAFAENNRY